MKVKYQCPECGQNYMVKLKLLDRWWCKVCDSEIDIEKTINEWANNGYKGEENGRPKQI